MSGALSLGLDHAISVVAPFAALHKADVVKLGVTLGLPLELSLSCMNPRAACTAGCAASAASGAML